MVVATLAPPIQAANAWTTVAIGPYTEGCVFQDQPTAWSVGRSASPSQACGLVMYGLPPSAAIRP